jgi:hypothetical protein
VYNAASVTPTQKAGIQKLSDAKPSISDANLALILDELNLLQTNKRFFLDDLALNTPATQMGANVATLTLPKVQAWRVIWGANLTDANYRKENATLTNLALLRNHPTAKLELSNFLGGDAGIQTLLQKNTYAPCDPCDPKTKHSWLNPMSDYIADLGYFVANYRNVVPTTSILFNGKERTQEGAIAVVQTLKSSVSNDVEGAAFILRVLRAEKITNIQAFEMRLHSFTPNVAYRKADLCYEKDGIRKIVDGKSYLPASFKSDFKKGGKKHEQFLDYFLNITNLNPLEFWFDGKKMPNQQYNYIYTLFQELMILGPLVPSLTDTGQAWFNAIWNNQILRNNIFPINNTEALRKNAIEEFGSMIRKSDNRLFSFIKIK